MFSITFIPETEISKEDNVIRDWISCIFYLIQFKKNKVQALINFRSEVNIITPAYVLELGLKICRTNVKTQKINSFSPKIFGIVLASFYMKDKLGKSWFF